MACALAVLAAGCGGLDGTKPVVPGASAASAATSVTQDGSPRSSAEFEEAWAKVPANLGLAPRPKVQEPEEAVATPPPPGLLVRAAEGDAFDYVPWKSEYTLQSAIGRLKKAGGGEIQVLPGDYEIHQGLHIVNAKDITIRGTDRTRFFFAPAPEAFPKLLSDVNVGDKTIEVDDASEIQLGWNYQVYKASLKGGRTLEFKVVGIEGQTLTLDKKVAYMGHVKEIPAGSVIIEHVNFFTTLRSENIVFSGLHFDGRSRGSVHGHTTFCGMILKGNYRAGKRPIIFGVTVEGCSFRNLKGRGLAAYGLGDLVVRGSYFDSIDSQAVEIDHYSNGTIVGNEIHRSGVGVALNDAFESIVESNVISDCLTGIGFHKHFDEDWVNTGNRAVSNVLIRCTRIGGVVFTQAMQGNRVEDNLFGMIPEDKWIVDATGNSVENNTGL